MRDDRHEFAELMQRVCTGSDGAARELVERYGTHVLRIVRRKLTRELRPRFDSVDFVQAVWASFFALPLAEYNFQQSHALVGFLLVLARNKVIEVVRQRMSTHSHDINRERSLHDLEKDEVPTGGPTAEEIAIAREEWQRLLTGQPEHYQQMLAALRGGETKPEVARQFGVTERTIRRVIRKLAPGKSHESR